LPNACSDAANASTTTMVKVEIVQDQDEVNNNNNTNNNNNSPYASHASSRTGSSASLSSVESELGDESLYDRLTALRDIVPPSARHSISSKVSSTASFIKRGGKILGNIVWIVTTSALLVGLPLALSLEDEAKIVAQEKEMLAQQQGAQQVCPLNAHFTRFLLIQNFFKMLSGGSSMYPQPGSEQQPKGIVPPGF
jgi:mitochondrial import receptor subunit TOM22